MDFRGLMTTFEDLRGQQIVRESVEDYCGLSRRPKIGSHCLFHTFYSFKRRPKLRDKDSKRVKCIIFPR